MRCNIIVLAALVLLGCNGNNGKGSAEFRNEKSVSTQAVGDPLVVGVPVDLCVEGDYLFVLAYTPGKWLHIYDKKTGEKVSDAILFGRGPGEAVNLINMDYRREERVLYLFDMVLRKTLVYALDGITGSASYVREISHPTEGVIRKCHVLPDNRFLYEGYLPEYGNETRFTLSDGKKVLDAYSVYPSIEREEDRHAFILGVSRADPESGRFVSGTTFGAVLETFDLSGAGIKPLATRILDLPEMEVGRTIQMKEGGKYGFSTICVSKKQIYAVYLDSPDANAFRTIATFDWRGRELTKYNMDKNILRMCIENERNGLFYGIASSPEMEFSLVSFTLD